MDIGDRERKRAQEDEYLAQLKISRADAEKVRETAIVEAATQIREAMGLPDDESGYSRALDISSQLYYKPTAEEWKNGTALVRVNKQEKDDLPALLDKLKMNNFRERLLSGTEEVSMPERQTIQEPVGTVGVEDQGTVRKPTSAFTQSKGELQQSADREMLTQQPIQPTVNREMTADDLYRVGVNLGITEKPEFQNLMSTLSRQDVMKKERETPITKEEYAAEMAAAPVESKSQFYKDFPSSEEAKKREIDKVRAQKASRGSPEVKLKDLLSERRGLENTKRQIQSTMTSISDKLRKPMTINRDQGESEESLKEQRNILAQQLTGIDSDINMLDSDIDYLRGKQNFPEPPPLEAPTGPSEGAQKVSRDIMAAMQQEAPQGYAVITRYGKPTWSKGKGKKTKYYTADFNAKLLEQVLNYANSLGVDIPTDKLSINLQKHSLEDVIDAIIIRSGGK